MITIAIAGPSGSGKTYGLRNIDPKELLIISPYKKIADLPFSGAMKNFKKLSTKEGTGNFVFTNNIVDIPQIIKYVNEKRPDIRTIVIEDITHFQNARVTSDSFRARKHGGEAFARYDDFAADMKKGLLPEDLDLRDDLTIVHHYHTDETDYGELKFKTAGKMLDSKIDLPSYYSYVLYTYVKPMDNEENQTDRFVYTVKHDGIRPAKTPHDLFDSVYVPNDLDQVIKKIHDFLN